MPANETPSASQGLSSQHDAITTTSPSRRQHGTGSPGPGTLTPGQYPHVPLHTNGNGQNHAGHPAGTPGPAARAPPQEPRRQPLFTNGSGLTIYANSSTRTPAHGTLAPGQAVQRPPWNGQRPASRQTGTPAPAPQEQRRSIFANRNGQNHAGYQTRTPGLAPGQALQRQTSANSNSQNYTGHPTSTPETGTLAAGQAPRRPPWSNGNGQNHGGHYPNSSSRPNAHVDVFSRHVEPLSMGSPQVKAEVSSPPVMMDRTSPNPGIGMEPSSVMSHASPSSPSSRNNSIDGNVPGSMRSSQFNGTRSLPRQEFTASPLSRNNSVDGSAVNSMRSPQLSGTRPPSQQQSNESDGGRPDSRRPSSSLGNGVRAGTETAGRISGPTNNPGQAGEVASRKRLATPESLVGADHAASQAAAKRRRIEAGYVARREALPLPEVSTAPFFDDDPSLLLKRSIALALSHVGFDSASAEAMDSFVGKVDSYMTGFAADVQQSMLSSRRAATIPYDFAYALRRDGLDRIALQPHLEPPVALPNLGPRELEPPVEVVDDERLIQLLGPELNGEVDKNSHGYIPKHLPPFPSKHTYKSTAAETKRESDPRKLREKATEAAKYAEDALRRLTKRRKAGGQKELRKAATGDKYCRERHELWEKAMSTFAPQKSASADDDEDEYGTIVNAEKKYWRKGAAAKKHTVHSELQ